MAKGEECFDKESPAKDKICVVSQGNQSQLVKTAIPMTQKPWLTGGMEPTGDDVQKKLQRAVGLHHKGRLKEALAGYDAVLAAQPRHSSALLNKAIVLQGVGRRQEAENWCKKAVKSAPDSPLPKMNLAAMLTQQQPEAADAQYRELLQMHPDFAHGYNNYGIFLLQTGRVAEAKAIFERGITVQPAFGEMHFQLANIRTYKAGPAHLQQMKTLITLPDLPERDRMYLGFALGAACEKAKRYEEALRYFQLGNRIRRRDYPDHNTQRDSVFFARIREVFSAPAITAMADSGCKDTTPIFILGMPRSGTTLVEQVLASHSEVTGGGELPALDLAVNQEAFDLTGKYYPEYVPDITRETLDELAGLYLRKLRTQGGNAAYITDKMPGNFRFIGMIRMLFPQARIVYCKRDPEENCWSIFKMYFAEPQPYAYDLGEVAAYYREHEMLMAHWLEQFPDAIHTVSYEDFVTDTKAQARRLLAFCGLPWEARCLDFHKTRRKVKTASLTQVRQPIYKTSLARASAYGELLAPLRQELESR